MIGGLRTRIDTDIARQSTLSARIAREQGAIATGKRLQVASDDPLASARIADLRQARASIGAWQANAVAAASVNALTDSVMGSIQLGLDRARELVTLANNATASSSDHATQAAELRSIADDLEALAATRVPGGAKLFADDALRIPLGSGHLLMVGLTRDEAFGSGTSGLVQTLRLAAAQLTGTDADRATALAAVTASGDRVADAHAVVGIRGARIDEIAGRLAEQDGQLSEETSALSDTDIAAASTRIQADQLSLDASRALFARINRQSLFDLLG